MDYKELRLRRKLRNARRVARALQQQGESDAKTADYRRRRILGEGIAYAATKILHELKGL